MANLSLRNINKVYENKFQAVYDFNLEINDHDFIVLVGPSGCGKSTTLRMIAGLEEISSGEFYIDGKLMNDILPRDRDIAMVFQSYALYPHMTVADNMGFALKMRKVPKAEIKERVERAAEILELTPLLKRKPRQLSGGQRQRVALGRAIVRNAKVFLMDEPLSNLDAKLRVQMRTEIIKLHNSLKATTIYVTHDQTEAMTMATKIVVMKDGYIQQIGSPKEVYDNPANLFVAGFMGAPAMNFIDAEVVDEKTIKTEEGLLLSVPDFYSEAIKNYVGKKVIFGVRPESLNINMIDQKHYDHMNISLLVDVSELLGNEFILYGSHGSHELRARVSAREVIKIGDKVDLTIDMNKVIIFDPETKKALDKN